MSWAERIAVTSRRIRRVAPAFEAAFQVLGFSFVVRSNITGLGPIVSRLLAGFRAPTMLNYAATFDLTEPDADERFVEVQVDGDLLVLAVDAGSAIDHLIAEITRRALHSNHRFVALHAGVVSHADVGVVIPGASGRGKSTLTCALIMAGFGFLSDEVALIEPGSCWAHPFPRPAALAPDSLLLLGLPPTVGDREAQFQHFERHLTANDLRSGEGTSLAVPVRFIVVPVIVPGSSSAVESMKRSDTLELLLGQCFDLGRLGGRAVECLGELTRRSECFQLRMGEMGSAVEAVERLLD